MKNKILIILLITAAIALCVAPAFSQDSITNKPVINSPMFLLSDDKVGKYVYGTISVTGNIALIIGATKAFKEDHKLRNHFAISH